MPGTRKLGRATDHRMAMLRGLVTHFLEHGRVETTVTRAKEVRSLAEKYITIGKTPTLANKRQALAFITKEDVVKQLFDEIAPVYANRNGGYTRIVRTGPRRGDGAEMAILELVVEEKVEKKSKAASKPRATRNRKREVAVEAPAPVAVEEEVAAVEEAPVEEPTAEDVAIEAVAEEVVVVETPAEETEKAATKE